MFVESALQQEQHQQQRRIVAGHRRSVSEHDLPKNGPNASKSIRSSIWRTHEPRPVSPDYRRHEVQLPPLVLAKNARSMAQGFEALRLCELYRAAHTVIQAISRMKRRFGTPLSSLAWPWADSFQKIVRDARPLPFKGSHLMFGSDYSGGHPSSRYLVYCFLIADADFSPNWPQACRDVRAAFLQDSRRMSFKSMNDIRRRRALIPFLRAAELLTGHIVTVVVSKELASLSTGANSLKIWKELHGLQGSWRPLAFEAMTRIAHFFTLLVATWATPGTHVTWITDDDEIVANDERLDDAHQFAAALADQYVPYKLGEFAMNTCRGAGREIEFEDFVAIPDLVAGCLFEICTKRPMDRDWRVGFSPETGPKPLSAKSQIISDWFFLPSASLGKSSILIDRADKDRFFIGTLAADHRP